MKRIALLFLMICYTLFLFAQRDTTYNNYDEGFQIIENYIQNNDIEGEFEDQDIFEKLEIYARNPVNLNKSSFDELEELQLLSPTQISALIDYRAKHGKLISIYELQAVPGFDILTIKNILPFIKVSGDLDDTQMSLKELFSTGRNQILARWDRVLEQKKGYTELEDDETGSRYLGDPNRFYFRFKHTNDTRLSYGITMEKDPGEEFFTGSNKNGFDFYSAHIFIKKYSKRLKAIAIGDFAASFGQGLVLFSGFGRGKGPDVMAVRRSASTLRAFSSVSEALFYRGGGVTLGLTDHIELTVFGSRRFKDGNLLQPDTLDAEEQVLRFSSLQITGLHRTEAEIEDKGGLQETVVGGSLKYQTDHAHIAFNALYTTFDRALSRSPRPYNQFFFSGSRLLNLSTDYSFVYRNFNFFGETAVSDNGGLATLNGLLIGLDRKVNMSLMFRHYEKEYQALNVFPFAEAGGGRNETGLYIGLQIIPNRNWSLQTYYDIFRHPYLRFSADAPSTGYEYLAKLTYRKKRKMEAYIQYRFERKQENVPDPEARIDYLLNRDRTQFRVHFSYNVTSQLTLKSRAEYAFFNNNFEAPSKGFMLYQDIVFKPKDFPLSLTTRYAIYNTDDYDSRIYAYENSILNDFLNPAYYNQGSRFYINLRFTKFRNASLELRYAQTLWENENTIGSGLEEINGNTRSDIRVQAKFRF